ncbi:hypothetical protein ACN6KF_005038 [Labrys sp. La1]|uniref:hypothetical protein n=1 Tax=Labrys sp. La1 TaxID=3404917 RepID=UPI003EBE6A75
MLGWHRFSRRRGCTHARGAPIPILQPGYRLCRPVAAGFVPAHHPRPDGVGATTYGAITTLLSLATGEVLRGERLSPLQWFGIAAALFGVVLLRIEG